MPNAGEGINSMKSVSGCGVEGVSSSKRSEGTSWLQTPGKNTLCKQRAMRDAFEQSESEVEIDVERWR